jgi:hypothetical protein
MVTNAVQLIVHPPTTVLQRGSAWPGSPASPLAYMLHDSSNALPHDRTGLLVPVVCPHTSLPVVPTWPWPMFSIEPTAPVSVTLVPVWPMLAPSRPLTASTGTC